MNKSKLGVFIVFWIFFIGCNQSPKTAIDETNSNNEKNFEQFKTNFKSINLYNLKKLGEEFNNHFMANEDSLIEVSQNCKSCFLTGFNTDNIYYGFKTLLPNKSVILTFFKHYGTKMNEDGEVIDTSYFVSFVFNNLGLLKSNFRSFGSNLTGVPPTYNMTSTFKYKDDGLIITNYEYSTGKNYGEAIPLSDTVPIYEANLIKTTYYLSYKSNEVKLINKIKSKTKVLEYYPDESPVYLKPIDIR